MQRFRRIVLQGSSRGLLPPLLLFVFLITTSGIPAHAADDPTACRATVARIVSIQGSLEVLRASQNDWTKVTRLDTLLCEGDRLRTGPLSRAALFIQPETLVRVDQNTSISVSQSAEETLVEFTHEDVLPAAASAYSCGAGYFITRFPRKFRVNTPHLNAAVEGTEFLVAMRCESTELSVFEGKVLAAGAGANIFPAQSISSGQVLTIGGSEPPAVKLQVKPADAVQWALYYPPLSDAKAEADLPPPEQCRGLPKPLDQTCLTQRAETLLRLGRVDEAQHEVDEAVALDPGSGDANALRAIISIARNDKAGAIEAATAATTALPNSSRAWLALSYAQQASFKLEDSLASARKAQTIEPNSSVTNARVAELLMSLGRIKEAEVASRAAVDANPSESRAHTVLGFVHLAQINTKAARADFEAAIERDSSDPMPRLGLGLAIIRTGKLAEGREQLEIAVALDPTNSLLRSYAGKAYYEENSKERDQLAAGQFDLGKKLDPNDPTPWFYDAILKQTQNRPIEALQDLQKSIELNDNRAVYRSKLLLDEDQAARDIGVAITYTSLDFQDLALVEATNSLSHDPANYGAHKFLADTYATLPRSEIASASELLQAQLLQPIGAYPAVSRQAEIDLISLNRVAPADPVFSDYSSLFVRDGAKLQFNGLTGNNSTRGEEVLVSGATRNLSLAIGQFRYQTEGFRPNNDYDAEIYDANIQVGLSDQTTVQIEGRSRSTDHGDITLRFDPQIFFPGDRTTVDADSWRIGVHTIVAPGSDIIATAIMQRRVEKQHIDLLLDPSMPPAGRLDAQRDDDATLAELQYIGRFSSVSVIGGGGYVEDKVTNTEIFEIFGSGPPDTTVTPSTVRQRNAYVYVTGNPVPAITLTIGLSVDRYSDPELSRNQTSPKFGVVWRFSPNTTVRAAAFRELKRVLVADQTLEPTQVAGFNQLFDDLNGTRITRYGVALDQRFNSKLLGGIELSKRYLDVPFGSPPLDESRTDGLDRVYLYWTPLRTLAIGLEFQYATFDNDIVPQDPTIPKELDTGQVSLGASWYPTERIYLALRETQVHQNIKYPNPSTTGTLSAQSDFWLTDLSAGYRFPRRYGTLSLEVNNLFNANFSYQDLNFNSSQPRLSPFQPERTIIARLNLVF